jgi:AcrR family transcriptional regulator
VVYVQVKENGLMTGNRSEDTREAIREAAKSLFTEQGFDATGVRDIAAAAGVNPALVIRYFGSKTALFVEVVSPSEATADVFATPIDGIGHAVARWAFQARRGSLDPLAALLGASQNPDVRARIGDYLFTGLTNRIVSELDVPDAPLRAHLFATQLLGLLVMLALELDPQLTDFADETLVQLYGDGLQSALNR